MFGGHGRLGSAIADAARQAGKSITCIGWPEAKQHAGASSLRARTANACEGNETDVIFANGLTDPARPRGELFYSNYEFPIQAIQALRDAPGIRFLTFGTVMEDFSQLVATNHYLASKRALATGIEALALNPHLSGRVLHLRLHTLYGGKPAAHSFLGQICASLQCDEPFMMSGGQQLREFHHVNDVARSVLTLSGRAWDCSAASVSFGRPVHLRTLAERIFAAFGRSHLLKLGRLPTPHGENFERVIRRSPEWLIGHAREPVASIIDWLAGLIGRANKADATVGVPSRFAC